MICLILRKNPGNNYICYIEREQCLIRLTRAFWAGQGGVGPDQPRKHFDDEINALATDIKANSLLQDITFTAMMAS